MRKLFLLITLPLFALDYATKEYIVRNFEAPPLPDDPRYNFFTPESVNVINGLFDIVRVHNTGVAFGFGNGTATKNAVWFKTVGTDVTVSGDVNGDRIADFQIVLKGAISLVVTDFLL